MVKVYLAIYDLNYSIVRTHEQLQSNVIYIYIYITQFQIRFNKNSCKTSLKLIKFLNFQNIVASYLNYNY